MAWRLPEGGIGGFNAGFDTRGGERLFQAKTVDPSQKGVYQKNIFGFTGLTPEGQNVNKYRQDWQGFKNRKDVKGYTLDEQKDMFNLGFLGSSNPEQRHLKQYYPGAAELGMTPEDVYEQEELYKDAPKGYFDLAGGGIASTRPKMFLGGGLGIAALLGGTGLLGKLFGKGGKSRRKEIKSALKDAPVFKIPRPVLDEEELPVHALLEHQPTLGRADGGAVGLEPGIGSLMGYAKGGMVTRVRVPKGQSKWMKKFMNNMRDN